MRNRCCTRSWTQDPQAASSGSGWAAGCSSSWSVAGVARRGARRGRGGVVVDVVVVLLVVGGGAVVVVVVPRRQRLRSCGVTTMSGTGGLSTPSRLTVSVSSSPTLSTTVRVPARRPIPLREGEGQVELQLQVSRRAVVVVPGDFQQHHLARSQVDDRGIDRDALQHRGASERAEGKEHDRSSGDRNRPSGWQSAHGLAHESYAPAVRLVSAWDSSRIPGHVLSPGSPPASTSTASWSMA